MKISHATLRQFRNHTESVFNFGESINVLLGENGQGKTNVLEALSFLSLTKSFYASSDSTVLQQGKDIFEVEGKFLSDVKIFHTVRVAYSEQQKQKKFFVNTTEIEKLSSVIGQFPIVILSPENNTITFGSPSERRKFLDIVISQSSKAYLEDSIEYKRILRQRNKILSEAKGSDCSALIDPWDEMLVRHGSKIVLKRAAFTREFAPYVYTAYSLLVREEENPVVEYVSQSSTPSSATINNITQEFRRKLEQKKNDERRLCTTLVGPHRDDLMFSLHSLSLRQFASQGQHKTFLIALKVAEFFYLKERCSEIPIFLLDDVFSELDEQRSEKLIALIKTLGQIFITTTSEHVFNNTLLWNNECRKFTIKNGALVSDEVYA